MSDNPIVPGRQNALLMIPKLKHLPHGRSNMVHFLTKADKTEGDENKSGEARVPPNVYSSDWGSAPVAVYFSSVSQGSVCHSEMVYKANVLVGI